MTYTVSTNVVILTVAVVAWDLVWRSVALWRAARNDQAWWFGFLLIINSAGVLPIIYLMSHREASHHYRPVPHGTT